MIETCAQTIVEIQKENLLNTFPGKSTEELVTYVKVIPLNPSNAEASFGQSTRTQLFLKTIETLSFGIHSIALAEYSQMGTHMPGFQSFSAFLHHFVLAKLAASSIRVKNDTLNLLGVCVCSSRVLAAIRNSAHVYGI